MQHLDLYALLLQSYSDENLNRITRKLIDLYRNKNFSKIREIVRRVSNFIEIEGENDSRNFSRLVFLYHPDRGEAARSQIEKHFADHDLEGLTRFSHIMVLNDVDKLVVEQASEDIDFNEEYDWDENTEGYRTFYDSETDLDEEDLVSDNQEVTFYNAIKLRMYGDMTREFPTYYLEDMDEIELSDSGIESLEGAEYCKHAVSMDLSNNAISDLSELWELELLEELYLANNEIGYIDTLSNLLKLRVVDLSGNQVDDISPLFDLENLEYVNLIANPVPQKQLDELRKKGVIVMF
jgi:hypothetical protein